MKHSFTTLDIVCMIHELRSTLIGLRVDQVYDVDKKTYLIRLTKTDVKKMLILESGVRFHSTTFEWPKNPAPSGFTMKLRKHLCNKRLEKITQVGADRIIDFQFGMDAFAFHVFLELYDRGNLLLTDGDYNILNLLRPRIQGAERLAAHEKYAVEKAKQQFSLSKTAVDELVSANGGKNMREIFLSKVEFGPPLFVHVLKPFNLAPSTKIPSESNNQGVDIKEFSSKVFQALENGRNILENFKPSGGFIVLTSPSQPKKDSKQVIDVPGSDLTPPMFYDQFHPSILLPNYEGDQNRTLPFPSFDAAVDEYFCKIESQKIDMKQMNHEKDALKKLEKVKLDQLKRIEELQMGQEVDKRKAELITMNQSLVDAAIAGIRTLVANQIPWDEIWEQIKEAKANEDPIATSIVKLQLIKNQFLMNLKDPYLSPGTEDSLTTVDIDLGLSAYANATKYYDQKRQSAKKEERTLESQDKAIKSTEKKTLATLKEVATIHNIKKARKILWFEKFRWFISSENYLILGGRDAQQNELLVKRYLQPRDIYLHADAHGAPTVIIKNDEQSQPVLPKTLNEAGCFAVCCSGSWDSKVVTSVWWVWGDQVSKSAPTGEYLPTGSFMIRGKKNYLPPVQLVLGFGFIFRLTDECVNNHMSERMRRTLSTNSDKEVEVPTQTQENEKNSSVDQLHESEFPDTQVKLKLGDTSQRLRSQASAISISSGTTLFTEDSKNIVPEDGEDTTIVVSTGLVPVVISAQKLLKDKKKADKKVKENAKSGQGRCKKLTQCQSELVEVNQDDEKELQQEQKPKRGQHGRNKKLKEKYKDQDDEDREIRMRLLQGDTGSVTSSPSKKGKGKGKNTLPASPLKGKNDISKKTITKPANDGTLQTVILGDNMATQAIQQSTEEPDKKADKQNTANLNAKFGTASNAEVEKNRDDLHNVLVIEAEAVQAANSLKIEQEAVADNEGNEEIEEEGTPEAERNILHSLTGCPIDGDELLFAVPVVAPYSTLQSYKFKIKMIPGTAKRGKAAKNALEAFLRDKSASPRERDLLKSVKDQDLARNFPGKVKLAGGHDKK